MSTHTDTAYPVAQRVQHFGESVIREMTRFALQHDAINLSQGMPDFPTPEGLKKLAMAAIDEDYNQYPFTWGTYRLREAIAKKHAHFYQQSIDPEAHVVVCCGSSEAMLATYLALLNPGDEVILFEPYYENYVPDAYLTGATPVYVTLHGPDWHMDEDEVKAAFTDKTRAIVICSPNNPTGKVFSKEELTFLADLCQKHNVLAFTDEIYEHMTYDGHQHIPMATIAGMEDRTITISGFSKTFSITGWRVGYALGPEPYINAIRKAHDFMTIGAPNPFQRALAQFLNQTSPDFYTELAISYQHRRDILTDILQSVGFKITIPHGAYYIMADITELTDKPCEEFARQLVAEGGVTTVPGASFYREEHPDFNRYIRFCYPKTETTLREAEKRLHTFFNQA